VKTAFEQCGILSTKLNGAKRENIDYVLYKVNERILSKLTQIENEHQEITEDL
jgi:hypothetical protein